MPVAAAVLPTVVGGAVGLFGANRAADAQQDAAQSGIDSQERMLERIIQLNMPQTQLGYGAVNELSNLFGYGGGQQGVQMGGQGGQGGRNRMQDVMGAYGMNGRGRMAGMVGEMTGRMGRGGPMIGQQVRMGGKPQQARGPQGMQNFIESPDYNFRKTQGLQGIAQTLGAGGQGAFSGNALRGMNDFNSNLASGEFGNYINRRLAMAGLGQAANMSSQDAMQGAGANIGGMMMDQGNARASGIMGSASIIGGGLNSILDAYLNQGGLNGRD